MKKCDQCDNEATVHEVTVRNGVKVEKHLCEACAAAQGISAQPSTPFNELIKHYVLSHAITPAAAAASAASSRAQVCPTCRTTFNEFRQHGLLGCPDCYRVFEAQLGPLLERAHDGGIKHSGKLPKRQLAQSGGVAPTPAPQPVRSAIELDDRAARLRKIRKQLESAVAAEKYEEAARLRDELKKMGGPDTPAHP